MNGPLSGVKVLDFSTLLPGPYATTMLVDLGAEVTRIESPTRPDLIRALPPYIGRQSVVHLALNRGKRSVAIDLKRAEGQALAQRLARTSDIVVEQFRPGVMKRLGLDYPTLSAINPSLIYCSITGYGQYGPFSQRAGHDINYLALSGIASYSGRRGEGPRLSGAQLADLAGGAQPAVIAILAALLERHHTQKGRHLDISMSDGALALNALSLTASAYQGESPTLSGTFLNGGTLYDYYQTQDHRTLAVGSLEPQFALQFFTAIGQADWAQEALKPPGEQTELKEKMNALLGSQTLAYWCAIFDKLDCCVEPVLTLQEALEHPHFNARGLLHRESLSGSDSDSQEELVFVLTPLSLSFRDEDQALESATRPGASLGEDTSKVLSDFGLSIQEIDDLKSQKIVL